MVDCTNCAKEELSTGEYDFCYRCQKVFCNACFSQHVCSKSETTQTSSKIVQFPTRPAQKPLPTRDCTNGHGSMEFAENAFACTVCGQTAPAPGKRTRRPVALKTAYRKR